METPRGNRRRATHPARAFRGERAGKEGTAERDLPPAQSRSRRGFPSSSGPRGPAHRERDSGRARAPPERSARRSLSLPPAPDFQGKNDIV